MEANFVLFKVVKIKYRLDIEPCFDRLIFTQLGPNKTLLFFVSARLGSAVCGLFISDIAQPLISVGNVECGRSIWIYGL